MVGISTWLGYDHYLNLAPYGWDITSCQAGAKDFDQVRNKDLPSLLKLSWEYPIHTWTFIWGEGIYHPPHFLISNNPRGHPPLQMFGMAGSLGSCSTLQSNIVEEVGSK